MDDKELTRLAQKEIQQEATRAKSRAESMGALGWQRCPIPSANKRFLHNMVMSTLEPRKRKMKKVDSAREHDGLGKVPSTNMHSREQKERHSWEHSRDKSTRSSDKHKCQRKHEHQESTRKHKSKSKHKDREKNRSR